ncbi:MAG: WYL domain-containing protein [Victivallaceae bacterium]|nr:WYL domain-containing protein [Victivallaceae bacterium]
MKKFKIAVQDSGDLLVALAPAIEHDVIRWVLGEAGKIRVIEPATLRKKIVEAGQRIAKANV